MVAAAVGGQWAAGRQDQHVGQCLQKVQMNGGNVAEVAKGQWGWLAVPAVWSVGSG